jgi:hypothetical protein
VANKEVGLEVNAEKTKYIFMSRDQTAYDIKVENNPSERVEQFKCLGRTLKSQNSIHEKIKCRLKSGNACYLLSSRLHSKNIEIKVYRTIILPVILYGYETWSVTLREEQRLIVFENRALRTIFGLKRVEETGEWRRLHNDELIVLYSSSYIIRVFKSRRI